jgi:hypothetical protein
MKQALCALDHCWDRTGKRGTFGIHALGFIAGELGTMDTAPLAGAQQFSSALFGVVNSLHGGDHGGAPLARGGPECPPCVNEDTMPPLDVGVGLPCSLISSVQRPRSGVGLGFGGRHGCTSRVTATM